MAGLKYTLSICGECAAFLGVMSMDTWQAATCDLCGLTRPLIKMTSRVPAADLRMALPAAKLKRDKAQQEREAAEKEKARLDLERRALELALSLSKGATKAELKEKLETVKAVVPQQKRVIDLS